jgi:predicted nucleic acid-binding protein
MNRSSSDLVLVDTSIWLQFLRVPSSSEGLTLARLMNEGVVATTGIIFAEVLVGSRSRQHFDRLADPLRRMHFLETTREVWERVADLAFTLKVRGASIRLPDIIIGAVALEYGCRLFARNSDFQRIPGLRIYEPQN